VIKAARGVGFDLIGEATISEKGTTPESGGRDWKPKDPRV